MNELPPTPHEAVVSSIASKSTGGGAGIGVLGALTENEAVAVAGVLIALLGLLVNFVFQLRRDRREAELLQAQLAAVRAAPPRGN